MTALLISLPGGVCSVLFFYPYVGLQKLLEPRNVIGHFWVQKKKNQKTSKWNNRPLKHFKSNLNNTMYFVQVKKKKTFHELFKRIFLCRNKEIFLVKNNDRFQVSKFHIIIISSWSVGELWNAKSFNNTRTEEFCILNLPHMIQHYYLRKALLYRLCSLFRKPCLLELEHTCYPRTVSHWRRAKLETFVFLNSTKLHCQHHFFFNLLFTLRKKKLFSHHLPRLKVLPFGSNGLRLISHLSLSLLFTSCLF